MSNISDLILKLGEDRRVMEQIFANNDLIDRLCAEEWYEPMKREYVRIYSGYNYVITEQAASIWVEEYLFTANKVGLDIIAPDGIETAFGTNDPAKVNEYIRLIEQWSSSWEVYNKASDLYRFGADAVDFTL